MPAIAARIDRQRVSAAPSDIDSGILVDMELLLLGTAAAEGWPAPFCVCDACESARRLGGRDVRTRSGALIDDELKIDFGPDTLMQLQRVGRNLLKVRTLIFTHQHSDHFVPSELEWTMHPFTLTPLTRPIEVCGNSEVIGAIRSTFAKDLHKLPFVYHQFEAGDHFTTEAGEEIWAMPADHCAGACLIRIRRNGKAIFYGHDSGAYPPQTLEQLSDGIELDIALLDCTFGSAGNIRGHMGAPGVVTMATELRRRGAITQSTRVIATHFSHGGKWLYEELFRYFRPHGIDVAYDGMIVQA
jgi:phosphoribosyl 1,2-cyclic phosphate phosphodiesterase